MPKDPHHKPQPLNAAEREIVSFLESPASYPERPDRIETIETHGARVFLAGDKAYKVKKHVKLPFLDFSTADRRREALERELALNREHAPEIYLGVMDINRGADGALTFGAGAAVDTALVMTRFDQSGLLDRIADAGPLPHDICRALADMAARYHRMAPPADLLSAADAMLDTIRALVAALDNDAPISDIALFSELRRLGLAEMARLSLFLDRRGLAGYVRRCHGDLHLRNIVMIDGRAVPFDALEFDERLATVDVLYDLAFLLMDLDVRGDTLAANHVLNHYCAAEPVGGEIEGLAALPLFLATRAAVRALVALETSLQEDRQKAAADEARARHYGEAAVRYLSPSPPVLLGIGGLSGTGKSTLALRLASLIGPSPGALVLRTDVERKYMFDVPESDRLSKDHYTVALSDAVYARLYDKAERALKAGHAVIVDAVSVKPEERDRIEAIARKAGVRFSGLWLEAPVETQIARVAARRGDASDSDAHVVCEQAERDAGQITWSRIDAGQTPGRTLAHACEVLGLPLA